LSRTVSTIGVKDASMISFFTGIILIMIVHMIILLSVRFSSDDSKVNWTILLNNLPSFRLIFILLLALTLLAIDLQIMKLFKINYPFIFELDPTYKVTPIELYSVRIIFIYFL